MDEWRESRPFIAVLGPPGSGKGTQCESLAAWLGMAHVSTGESLRLEIERGSDVGRRARAYVETGRLVPDDLVLEILASFLDHVDRFEGVLLDGFPRNVRQAAALENLWPGRLVLAVQIVVPVAALLRRLGARGRSDDRGEIAMHRLAIHRRASAPLVHWLTARGLLVHVDGNRHPDVVSSAIGGLVMRALATPPSDEGGSSATDERGRQHACDER